MATEADPTMDFFSNLSRDYEASTGGMTRELAYHLIDMILPLNQESSVLDNACGNGVVAQEIILKQPDLSLQITCTDAAKPMVNLATHSVQAMASKARLAFEEMPSEQLGFPDNHFTHSITNQGIMFFKDGQQGAKEIHRTLKPGGTAIVTTWKQLGYFPLVLGTQKVVTPDEPPFKVPISQAWSQAEFLEKTLQDAGLKDIKIQKIGVHYAAQNAQGVCGNLMKLFHMLFQGWSDEKKNEFQKQLEVVVEKAVVPAQRVAPGSSDGQKEDLVGIPCIALVAVAKK